VARIEKSIEIKAPPEKVWEILALDRFQEWSEEYRKSLKSMEYTSEVQTPEDKFRVGTSAHVNMKGMGMGEMDFEISESLENERITYLGKRPRDNQPIANLTFILEPVEEGTKFTHIYDYKMPLGIIGKFLDKAYSQRWGENKMEKELEEIKSIVEK